MGLRLGPPEDPLVHFDYVPLDEDRKCFRTCSACDSAMRFKGVFPTLSCRSEYVVRSRSFGVDQNENLKTAR
jgi:hypothetical protein